MYVPRGRLQQATDSLPRKPPASATSRTETSHNFPKVENARRGSTSSRHERPSFHSTSRYAYMLFLRGAQGIFRVHYQQYLANVQQAQKLRSNVAAWGAHYRARARDRNMVRRKDPSSKATLEASEQVEGDVSYCLVRARRFPLPRVGFWRASSGHISARMQKQARAREIAPAARCSGGARRTYRVWLGAFHRDDLDSGRGRGAHAPQTPPKSPRIAPIRTPLPLCTTKNSVNSASPRNGVA